LFILLYLGVTEKESGDLVQNTLDKGLILEELRQVSDKFCTALTIQGSENKIKENKFLFEDVRVTVAERKQKLV
jgi:hypothetical protein